jgi:hypothetical protein
MCEPYIKWVVSGLFGTPNIKTLSETIEDCYDGHVESYELEISLVKESNTWGQDSCGYADKEKIVLFDSETYQFSTVVQLSRFLIQAKQAAEIMCKALNESKFEFLEV